MYAGLTLTDCPVSNAACLAWLKLYRLLKTVNPVEIGRSNK